MVAHVDALSKINASLERRIAEIEQENAVLRSENERLRRELEEWKNGYRRPAGPRVAAGRADLPT